MTTRAVFLLLILTAFAYAATLVVNGTVKYTAFVKNNTVIIENDTVEIPPVRYTWDYNNTYTVFGIYYANSVCTISYWPNAPRFYIQCPVGTDFVIVAVKDPKAKVTCRVRNTPLQPRNQHDYVLIFQTRDLGVECESGYPPNVSVPSSIFGVLAGLTATTAAILIALGFFLLRRALFKK
ncbi:MAG: hypothetical protein QW680_02790 [Pyrobaculum sp.]